MVAHGIIDWMLEARKWTLLAWCPQFSLEFRGSGQDSTGTLALKCELTP